MMSATPFPGMDATEIRAQLRAWQEPFLPSCRKSLFCDGERMMSGPDLPWADDAKAVAEEAFAAFLWADNWSSGTTLPGRNFATIQAEIVGWVGDLFHGGGSIEGVVTSGGSESNYLGVLTGRSMAGRPGGSIVAPRHAHYSFAKAAGMFGLELIVVEPIAGTSGTVDVGAYERAIRDDTVALVATAGTMPFGGVDPIERIGSLAEDRGVHLHVDACCGGMILPFLERSGHDPDLPAWDFRVPGVSSISVDLHKHGMTPPPASLLLVRDDERLEALKRICPPQGTMSGTRSAGPVAAAWAMLQALGEAGYVATSTSSMRIRDEFMHAVASFGDLSIVPGSRINIFAFHSTSVDLFPVWEALTSRGWQVIHKPDPAPLSIPIWTLPQNEGMAEGFAQDLAAGLEHAPPIDPSAVRSSGVYGGIT